MIRYVLAGMATVAGVVLLFLGSFGSAPIPAGARNETGERSAAAQSGAQHEIVNSLREQLARARRDLAAMEAERKATPSGSVGDRADAGAVADAAEPAMRDQAKPAAAASNPTATTNDAAERQKTAAPAPAPAPVKPTRSAEATPSPHPSGDTPSPEPARGNEPTQPFGFPPHNRAETRSATAPPRQVREATAAPVRDPTPPPRDTSPPPTPAPSASSAADDVVERLRRGALAAPGFAATPPNAPPMPTALPAPVPAPRAGPHRIPAEDRLADARLAVLEGRVEDARRFLQAAQVQLVFPPVEPNDAPPPASLAAGPVGQALSALGYGDRGRALVAIDQAIGVLNGLGRLGSAPGRQADAGRSPLPLPTPRSWP